MAYARAKLKQFNQEDSIGLIVRSRHQEATEQERASLFHINREVKKGNLSRLDKLAKEYSVIENGVEVKEKKILESREEIEEETVTFFTYLFQGYHRSNGDIGQEPFEPDLSDSDYFTRGFRRLSDIESELMTKEISLEEVELAIKESACNKSPGLDGLTAEFYKATSNIVSPILVEVFNDQLGRLSLIPSNKHGATRLVSKVKGIPLINELRPITLLNLDYKFLTKF